MIRLMIIYNSYRFINLRLSESFMIYMLVFQIFFSADYERVTIN